MATDRKRQKCDQAALVKVLADVGGCSMTYFGRPTVPDELQRTGKAVLGGHANEIVPRLYLGSEHAAAAAMEAALDKVNVRTIVKCTFEPGREPGLAGASIFKGGTRIHYVHVAVRDEDSANILPYLPGAADLIQQQLHAGSAVLVHCQRGVSRSATIVIAFLIRHCGMSRDEAYVLAKGRRPEVSPNIGFWAQLAEFERSCRAGGPALATAAAVFDEDWARASLAAWSLAPTSHTFVDVLAAEEQQAGQGVAALAQRRTQALVAGLEFCLSRASCASGCVPSDVCWLRALCSACGDDGSGEWGVEQLRKSWEAELRGNWESDFSQAKLESLLAELKAGD
jgi:hypothetical protein